MLVSTFYTSHAFFLLQIKMKGQFLTKRQFGTDYVARLHKKNYGAHNARVANLVGGGAGRERGAQPREHVGELGGQDLGLRRQDLPELDEGRA